MWKELQKRLSSPDSFVSLILGLAVVFVIGTLAFNYISKRSPSSTQKKQEEAAKQQVSLPTTHTVAAGETLWSIAEKYFKR